VSPDAAVVDRLISTAPSLASYDPPKKFVHRYFDDRIVLHEEDVGLFVQFVDDLMGLNRKSFLAAMRAIRTFVTALHRMRDDLALAYTLLVSAVESLAQEFDSYNSTWQDIDERKRKPVDIALKRASKRTSDAVRAAVLSAEHGSLARRYRAFVLQHVTGNYFRSLDSSSGAPIARHELDEALRQAYALRSRYVHNVRQLPDEIIVADANGEVAHVDRRPVLTFQGLVRLTHHVISAFVATGEKIDAEPYNYTREQAGVVVLRWAPEMWVGAPLRSVRQARERLEGHLEQLVPVLADVTSATVTDLRPIFPDIERLAKSSGSTKRATLLTLYALFAALIPKSDRSPALDAMLEDQMSSIGAPGSDALIARTIFGLLEEWPIETHRETLDRYFAARTSPGGLHAPKLLDAAMCLALAERYRQDRQFSEACAMIAQAVETLPGHASILALEQGFSRRKRINWQGALLPKLARRRRRRQDTKPND
jgi:hypothetical protein